MPTVKAEVAGKVLTLLGYDGTDFYNVKVDSDNLIHATVSDSFGVPKRLQQDALLRLMVAVHESVLPAGAASAANQGLLLGKIKDQLFTFKETYNQKGTIGSAGVGTNVLDMGTVGANELWVVTSLWGMNFTTACTDITARIFGGGYDDIVACDYTVAAKEPLTWQGWICLPTGVQLRVRFGGCNAADVLFAGVQGFKMTV